MPSLVHLRSDARLATKKGYTRSKKSKNLTDPRECAYRTPGAPPRQPEQFQFGQSVLGRRVSFTKQDSQTLVPSLKVKTALRMKSISAPHFPQSSVCASLTSTPGQLRGA